MRELERDVLKAYKEGRVAHLDREGFWDYATAKYEKLFDDFLRFDGVILTFHETNYKIFHDSEVVSALSKPGCFAKFINTIDAVCKGGKKDLVVRSFLYESQEQASFWEGLERVPKYVMMQSKCIPYDWQSYYPHRSNDRRIPRPRYNFAETGPRTQQFSTSVAMSVVGQIRQLDEPRQSRYEIYQIKRERSTNGDSPFD